MASNLTPEGILSLVNQSRQQAGLAPLTLNKTLAKIAADKGNDMAGRGYFSHVNPDGKKGIDLIGPGGYIYNSAAENLAEGYPDAQSVYNAWLKSPTHKSNMFYPNFRDVGIAIVPGIYQGRKTNFIVQMFGEPQGASPAQAPTKLGLKKATAAKETPKSSPKESMPKTKLGQRKQLSPRSMIDKYYLGKK